jgi:hypothetical protein
MPGMLRSAARLHPDSDLIALEAYSSSAEFDAALIAARRAAGAYGPRRHRRPMLVTTAAIAVGLTIIVLLIV